MPAAGLTPPHGLSNSNRKSSGAFYPDDRPTSVYLPIPLPFLHVTNNEMTMSDASLPPNAPMTNGTLTPGHGEVDASPPLPASTNLHDDGQPSLKDVCQDIHDRVERFLAIQDGSDLVKRTQEQTRIGLGVIEKALREYEYGCAVPLPRYIC